MTEFKPWWRSSTIWAASGALVTSLTGFVSELAGLAEQIDRLAAAGFALWAIYGRIKANKQIGPDAGAS